MVAAQTELAAVQKHLVVQTRAARQGARFQLAQRDRFLVFHAALRRAATSSRVAVQTTQRASDDRNGSKKRSRLSAIFFRFQISNSHYRRTQAMRIQLIILATLIALPLSGAASAQS